MTTFGPLTHPIYSLTYNQLTKIPRTQLKPELARIAPLAQRKLAPAPLSMSSMHLVCVWVWVYIGGPTAHRDQDQQSSGRAFQLWQKGSKGKKRKEARDLAATQVCSHLANIPETIEKTNSGCL